MLGFTIPGQTIRYNVPVTVLSMLIAIAVVGAGLFIVGYSRGGAGPLLLGGVAIGCGVRRTCPLLCGNAALRRMTPGRQAVRSLGAYFAIIGSARQQDEQ